MSDPPRQHLTRIQIDKLRAGDRAAANDLFARHLPSLQRAVRARVPRDQRHRLDEDDLIQQTLLQALTHLDRFECRGEGAFLAWLSRIAANAALDALKRRDLRRINPAEAGDPVPLDELPGDGATPSGILRRDEEQERLEAALDSLTPEHRDILIEREILGLDLDALAEAHGKSKDAIRMQVQRAREALARRLGAE
jgi:RNA polymerase sigma-70 factor (ECF subfamily)